MRRNAYTLQGGQMHSQMPGMLPNYSMVYDAHKQSMEPKCQLINCYKVCREIGHGTFGKVFLVKTVTDQEYAMKVSKDNMAKYIKLEEDFLRKLGPYDIAPKVIDSFDYKGRYCLVMTNCTQKLSELVYYGLTLSQMKVLMRSAARQLQVLHKMQIIHTDIKTDNFLLLRRNDENSLRIIDFSSSLQLPREHMPTKLQSRYFKAPEVLHYYSYDYKIDMWGLGCLFYEIVFYRPMFPSKTDEMLVLYYLGTIGIPSYGAPEYFMQGSRAYYKNNEQLFYRYKIQPTSALLPTQSVMQSNGRPECEPRDIKQIIYEKTDWGTAEYNNFHALLTNLITYDPKVRWGCAEVLACDFLK